MRTLLKRFTWQDLTLISLIAAMSIVTKPYVRAPFAFVQNAFGIPVGSFIGGVYMFWPVLVGKVIPKPGAVLLTCLLQGFLALATGFTGLLGPAAFFSYLPPGLVIEAPFWLIRRVEVTPAAELVLLIMAGALGNAAGAVSNALLFFALSGKVVAVTLVSSLVTGGGGGWLAFAVGRAFCLHRDRLAASRSAPKTAS
ncbi:MAG: ECF transporter S component [Ignavibacteriales bacterium]